MLGKNEKPSTLIYKKLVIIYRYPNL